MRAHNLAGKGLICVRYTDPGAAMKKGKIWMLDPDAAFKPPGTVKTGSSAELGECAEKSIEPPARGILP